MSERKQPSSQDLDALVHTLAVNLRQARARSNWSTRVLSQQCDIDRRTIQRVEDGRFPGVSLRTLDALAKGLGVRTSSLLGNQVVSHQWDGAPAADIVGQNLSSLRAGSGLTQEGLAAESNVPRSVIAALETGARNPALTTLCKLSHALGVTVEQLVHEGKSA